MLRARLNNALNNWVFIQNFVDAMDPTKNTWEWYNVVSISIELETEQRKSWRNVTSLCAT